MDKKCKSNHETVDHGWPWRIKEIWTGVPNYLTSAFRWGGMWTYRFRVSTFESKINDVQVLQKHDLNVSKPWCTCVNFFKVMFLMKIKKFWEIWQIGVRNNSDNNFFQFIHVLIRKDFHNNKNLTEIWILSLFFMSIKGFWAVTVIHSYWCIHTISPNYLQKIAHHVSFSCADERCDSLWWFILYACFQIIPTFFKAISFTPTMTLVTTWIQEKTHQHFHHNSFKTAVLIKITIE